MTAYRYQGTELDLFQHAVNWKRYYGAALAPHIAGAVLEVGAGIGGTAPFLVNSSVSSWTCLEPDTALASRLDARLAAEPLQTPTHVVCGTVASLQPDTQFDTALYIDVLEHIESDASELEQISGHIAPGGHLIVLAPAHNWLFSPFDRAVGHFRRYSKASLISVSPSSMRLVRVFYLDCVGMLASAANRALLRSPYPTRAQIRFWDSVLVRASRFLDPVTFNRVGKTVVAIWTRQPDRR